MNRLLIKNAKAVVTVDDRDRVLEHVNIYIEDNEIVAIDDKAHEADELSNCSIALYPWRVSNSLPSGCRPDALPIELHGLGPNQYSATVMEPLSTSNSFAARA